MHDAGSIASQAEAHPNEALPDHGWVTPRLFITSGPDAELAAVIAAQTGDFVLAPFWTIGCMDRAQRYLVIALHRGLGVEAGSLEASVIWDGLPLTLPLIRNLAAAIFVFGELGSLIVRTHHADTGQHTVLRRLGFEDLGRDDRPDRLGRRIFVLHRERAWRFVRRFRLAGAQ